MDPAEVYTLHRYFVNANHMKHLFEEVLAAHGAPASFASQGFIEMQARMGYWYAGLFVVIEGWLELGLHDGAIDRLLQSKHVALLRRYRNGICHFQRRYFDARFLNLLEAPGVVAWIRDLNNQFGRFFLEYLRSHPHRDLLPPELRADGADEGGDDQA